MVAKRLVALAALSLLTGVAAKSPWSPERSQAIVRLEIPIPGGNLPRVGTGFVVRGLDSRHFVVSTTHTLFNSAVERVPDTCVDLPKDIRLLLGGRGGAILKPRCVYNLSSDISLIELYPSSHPAGTYPTLSLDVSELVQYETLHVAGFPFGYSLDSARFGVVTEPNGDKGMAVISALTAGGMSGGPYVRQDGSVVAVHHGQSGMAAGFAHAVHIAKMRAELEKLLPKLPAQAQAWLQGEPALSQTMSPLGTAIALRQVDSPALRKKIFVEIMGNGSLTPEIAKLLEILVPDPNSPAKIATNIEGTPNSLVKERVVDAFLGRRRACLDGDNIEIVGGLLYCNQESQFSPSPNVGRQMDPKLVMLHSTQSTNADAVIRTLLSPALGVSAHLVIDRDGSFFQLVNFERQARHAGRSEWQGMQYLNAVSIGIELVNAGRLVESKGELRAGGMGSVIPVEQTELVGAGRWQKFTPYQIAALDKILQALAKSYSLKNIVGHCEVTNTKVDPGPLLPVPEIERRILNLPSSRPYKCNLN